MGKNKRTGAIDVARDQDGLFVAAPVGAKWENHCGNWRAEYGRGTTEFEKGSRAHVYCCARSMRGLGLKPGEGPIRVTLTREDEG